MVKLEKYYELICRKMLTDNGKFELGLDIKLPEGFQKTDESLWGLYRKRVYANKFGNRIVELYRMKD